MSSLRRLAFRWSGRRLPVLSEQAWRRWTDGAAELARDRFGWRTLRTADGSHVVKELGLKRALSSATLRPYAERFVENAARLARLGQPAPEVEGAWRRESPREGAHVVVYRWRDGRELRESLRSAPSAEAAALVAALGERLARLHEAGADFRSGHLGNWLVVPEGLAVIDCADVRFAKRPLSERARAEALLALLARDAADRDALRAHAADFRAGYERVARLPSGAGL